MSIPAVHKGHYYAVDFDSFLGVQIRNYIQRCNLCDSSIRDFIRSVPQKYSFPLPVTDDTVYCLSDDCDAGGLLAIMVNKDAFGAAARDQRFDVIWSVVPSSDDADMLCIFPRMETHTHYIRYGQAVSLHERKAPDWSFMPPKPKDIAKHLKLHVVTYEEVRNRISKQDKDALVKKPGKSPSPSMRLAIGRQYVLRDEESGTDYAESEYFADAVSLFDQWMALPSVPSHTLARLLELKATDDAQIKDPDVCFCAWHTDADNHRYIIHTGLHSALLTDEIPNPS